MRLESQSESGRGQLISILGETRNLATHAFLGDRPFRRRPTQHALRDAEGCVALLDLTRGHGGSRVPDRRLDPAAQVAVATGAFVRLTGSLLRGLVGRHKRSPKDNNGRRSILGGFCAVDGPARVSGRPLQRVPLRADTLGEPVGSRRGLP